jgi:hypothetical protein
VSGEAKPGVVRVDKPWGYELLWARTDKYVGKIIHVNAGHALSLQYHNVKTETVSGFGQGPHADQGRRRAPLARVVARRSPAIPAGTVHRVTAIEDADIFGVNAGTRRRGGAGGPHGRAGRRRRSQKHPLAFVRSQKGPLTIVRRPPRCLEDYSVCA